MISIGKKIVGLAVVKEKVMESIDFDISAQPENDVEQTRLKNVKKPTEVVTEIESAPIDVVIRLHESLRRPVSLSGSTYKIKPPNGTGSLYVTFNDICLNKGTKHEHLVPFEIFLNSKNMEYFQWVTALTRIISAIFRKGGDVSFLINELKSIFDPRGGYYNPRLKKFMSSVIAEIGYILEDHLKELQKANDQIKQKLPYATSTEMVEETKSMNPIVAEKSSDEATGWFLKEICPSCSSLSMQLLDGCPTCTACGYSKCG